MSAPRPANPCRGCTKRHSHCHGECEPYLAFFAWHREENEQRRRMRDAEMLERAAIEKSKRYARQMKGRKT